MKWCELGAHVNAHGEHHGFFIFLISRPLVCWVFFDGFWLQRQTTKRNLLLWHVNSVWASLKPNYFTFSFSFERERRQWPDVFFTVIWFGLVVGLMSSWVIRSLQVVGWFYIYLLFNGCWTPVRPELKPYFLLCQVWVSDAALGEGFRRLNDWEVPRLRGSFYWFTCKFAAPRSRFACVVGTCLFKSWWICELGPTHFCLHFLWGNGRETSRKCWHHVEQTDCRGTPTHQNNLLLRCLRRPPLRFHRKWRCDATVSVAAFSGPVFTKAVNPTVTSWYVLDCWWRCGVAIVFSLFFFLFFLFKFSASRMCCWNFFFCCAVSFNLMFRPFRSTLWNQAKSTSPYFYSFKRWRRNISLVFVTRSVWTLKPQTPASLWNFLKEKWK